MVTSEELERLEGLLAKATPGPWRGYKGGNIHGADVLVGWIGGKPEERELAKFNGERWAADTALIVALRNLAPALIAGARVLPIRESTVANLTADCNALRADLQRVTEERDHWKSKVDFEREANEVLLNANTMRGERINEIERERDTAQRELGRAREALEQIAQWATGGVQAVARAALSGRAEGVAAEDELVPNEVTTQLLKNVYEIPGPIALPLTLDRGGVKGRSWVVRDAHGKEITRAFKDPRIPQQVVDTFVKASTEPAPTSGGGEREQCTHCRGTGRVYVIHTDEARCGRWEECVCRTEPTTPTPSEAAGEGPNSSGVASLRRDLTAWLDWWHDGETESEPPDLGRQEKLFARILAVLEALNATQSAPASDADALLDWLGWRAHEEGSVQIERTEDGYFIEDLGEGSTLREALRAARK